MALLPLIRKDLMVLARQRRWFIVRPSVAALVLMITGIMFAEMWKRVLTYGGAASNASAEAFAAFAVFQVLFVALPAPAFGVASLDEARSRGGLDLLRLAAIPRPLLAWTKLLGASAWPVLLSASLLPFLTLWTLWGGVTLKMVIAAACLTASTAIALAGLGLIAGSLGRAPTTVFGLAYGLSLSYLIGIPMLLYPLAPRLLETVHPPWALMHLLWVNPAANWVPGLASGVALAVAAATLSGAILLLRDRVPQRAKARTKSRTSSIRVRDALVWREFRTAGHRKTRWLVRASWGFSLLFVLAAEVMRHQFGRYSGAYLLPMFVAYPIIPMLMLSILGGASVSVEREARTLETILLTPRSELSIIGAKLAAMFVRALPLFLIPLVYGVAVVIDTLGMRTFEIAMVTILPSAICIQAAMFGLFCSVVFKRTSVAISVTLVGHLAQVIGLGYVFIWIADKVVKGSDWNDLALLAGQALGLAVLWLVLAIRRLKAD